MPDVRTIVVAVDGSERSEDALALGRRLTAQTRRLVLVCAYPADSALAGDGGATYVRSLRADAETTLARLGGETGCDTLAIADPGRAAGHCARQRVGGDADPGRGARPRQAAAGPQQAPGLAAASCAQDSRDVQLERIPSRRPLADVDRGLQQRVRCVARRG
jgi:hypothetical protein